MARTTIGQSWGLREDKNTSGLMRSPGLLETKTTTSLDSQTQSPPLLSPSLVSYIAHNKKLIALLPYKIALLPYKIAHSQLTKIPPTSRSV